MEAAGVALGAIPIALKLCQSYQTLSEKVETFRKYSHEIQRLDQTIRVKEQLFRNAVVRILESITRDPARAESLLLNSDELRKLGRTC